MARRIALRRLVVDCTHERFAECDLRAKVATDAEAEESQERARKPLGHVDGRVTKKWYLRKPKRPTVVQPYEFREKIWRSGRDSNPRPPA